MQKPEYQEVYYQGFKFFYQTEIVDRYGIEFQKIIDDFSYEYEIEDGISVFKNEKGQKALRFYCSVPTFDDGDREWDSYRKMYLIPGKEEMTMMIVTGGYRIAKIVVYRDVHCGDKKTKDYMMETGFFDENRLY